METGIFYKPKHITRALICFSIAVGLFASSVTGNLDPVRTYIDDLTNKIFVFNNGAKQLVTHISTNFKNVDVLNTDNQTLEKENTSLKLQISYLQAVEKENEQLRKLLGVETPTVGKKQIVHIINTAQGLRNDIIFLNGGTNLGLFLGQNIYDANGLVGQIISVSNEQSRVLLLTDVNSNIPAYDLRSNAQMIVQGTNSWELNLKYLNPKADIKLDDLIYTSGLGDRYVKNFPIARVSRIIRDQAGNLIHAYALPLANLTSLRYLIAVWPFCKHVANSNPALNAIDKKASNRDLLLQIDNNNRILAQPQLQIDDNGTAICVDKTPNSILLNRK